MPMLLSFGVAAVSFSSTTFAAGSSADVTKISGVKEEKRFITGAVNKSGFDLGTVKVPDKPGMDLGTVKVSDKSGMDLGIVKAPDKSQEGQEVINQEVQDKSGNTYGAENQKAQGRSSKGDEIAALRVNEGQSAGAVLTKNGQPKGTEVDVQGLTLIADSQTPNKGTIYANGIPITLKGITESVTKVYLDSDLNNPVVLPGVSADPNGAYNLSGYTIFGGSRDKECASSHVTMSGGNILALYGGGESKNVSGEARIDISGAKLRTLYGGGLNSAVGTATINIKGPSVISTALYGGSSGHSCNNVSINVTSGAIMTLRGGSDGPFDTNGNVSIVLSGVNPLRGGLIAGPGNESDSNPVAGSINGNLDISILGTSASSFPIYSVTNGSIGGTSTLSVAGMHDIKVNINGGTLPVTNGFKSIHVASSLTGGTIDAVLPGGYQNGVIGTNVSAGDLGKFKISGESTDKVLKLEGTDLKVKNKVTNPVTDILLDLQSQALPGVDYPITATVSPVNATNRDIRWSVVDAGTTGAHIENGSILKTTGIGTVRIKAVVTEGISLDQDFIKEFTLVVMNPVTDITGYPEHAIAGTDLPLTATVSPADATNKDISWTVSDGGTTGAAIVNGNILRTTAPGTARIKATIADGAGQGKDFTKELDVSVMRAVTGITNFNSNAVAGTDLPLTGTVSPADATHTAIQWAVSDGGTTGAFIDSGNILKTTAPGTAKVTATITDGLAVGADFTCSFEVSVMRAVTGISDIPTSAVAGTDLPLTGTVTPADATHTAIQWTVTDPGTTGATIVNSDTTFSTAMSGQGTYFLKTVKAGTARIKAVIADGSAAGRDFVKEVDITVDKSDAQKLEEAKSKAENELKGMTVTKDTTPDDILNAVQQAVNSAGNVSVTWTKGPVITSPASDKEGSVTGTITLKLGGQTVDIPVNFTVPRLPATNEEKLDSAVSQAETVLDQITADNNTTPDSIQQAVQDALGPGVTVEWLKDPVIIPATADKEGSVTGTLVVEINGEKKEVPVNITIPKLPGGGGHTPVPETPAQPPAPGNPKPDAPAPGKPVPVKTAKSVPQTGDMSQEPATSAVMLAAFGASAILIKLIKKRN